MARAIGVLLVIVTAFAAADGPASRTLEGHQGTVRPGDRNSAAHLPRPERSSDLVRGFLTRWQDAGEREFLWNDHTPRPRDLESGGEWKAEGSLRSLAFSPDGKTVAADIDRDIKVWDATTGQLRRTLTGHSNWVIYIAFSPDGKTLASGSSDETVKLWPLN